MLYNGCEDYMRSVLGYSNTPDNLYQQYNNNYCNMQHINNQADQFQNLRRNQFNQYQYTSQYQNPYQMAYETRKEYYNVEQMYPEVYRIINPMVCTMCQNNNQPITEELIEQMTDEIYRNVEKRVEFESIVNLKIETREADRSEGCKNCTNNMDCENCKNCASNKKSENNRDCSKITNSRIKEKQTEKVGNVVNQETRSEDRLPLPRRNQLLRDLIRILILNQLFRPNRPPFRPDIF